MLLIRIIINSNIHYLLELPKTYLLLINAINGNQRLDVFLSKSKIMQSNYILMKIITKLRILLKIMLL